MSDSKVIFGQPGFEAEQMFVREQLVFKVKDSTKRGLVPVDKEFMVDYMKFKFFDSILDRQNLFVNHMIIFELSACMCTEMSHVIYFFKKNNTPIIITSVCKIRCPVVGILSKGGV